jgi:V/A-type H+-transporting ATPase subunit A
MEVLQREAELQEIVQLVGSDALPDEQKMTLEVARMIREIFLQQNAYHKVDTYCPLPRQYKFMKLIKQFSDLSKKAVEAAVPVDPSSSSRPQPAGQGQVRGEHRRGAGRRR